MGFDEAVAGCAIRVSLGPQTTEDDILRFAECWLKRLQKHRGRLA
jgi:cysteine desulfurase